MNTNNKEYIQPQALDMPSVSIHKDKTDQDDITAPYLEGGLPTVNSIPDPFLLTQDYQDDWDMPPQEISEEDGRPTLPSYDHNYRNGRW